MMVEDLLHFNAAELLLSGMLTVPVVQLVSGGTYRGHGSVGVFVGAFVVCKENSINWAFS